MTEIIIDVAKYLVWYWLLIAGIIILTLWATLKQKNFMPLAWGSILSGAIYLCKDQIAPLIFGVGNYDYSDNIVMFVLTGVFAVTFFMYIALTIWNLYQYNEVIA